MTRYANLIERLEVIRDSFEDLLTDAEVDALNQAMDLIESNYDPADDDLFREASYVLEFD